MNVPQELWRNFITFWSDSTSSIVYLTGVILNTSVELLKMKSQKMFLYMFWGNFTVCSELKSKMATLASDGLKHIWYLLQIGWNRPIACMPDHHKMARNVPLSVVNLRSISKSNWKISYWLLHFRLLPYWYWLVATFFTCLSGYYDKCQLTVNVKKSKTMIIQNNLHKIKKSFYK